MQKYYVQLEIQKTGPVENSRGWKLSIEASAEFLGCASSLAATKMNNTLCPSWLEDQSIFSAHSCITPLPMLHSK